MSNLVWLDFRYDFLEIDHFKPLLLASTCEYKRQICIRDVFGVGLQYMSKLDLMRQQAKQEGRKTDLNHVFHIYACAS